MSDDTERTGLGDRDVQPVVLTGVWFRHERERIAIGRPSVAAWLGVPVGQVAVLEVKDKMVPEKWGPLLATLGFHLPSVPSPAPEASRPDASPVITAPAAVLPDQGTQGEPTAAPVPSSPADSENQPALVTTAQPEQAAAPATVDEQHGAENAAPPPPPHEKAEPRAMASPPPRTTRTPPPPAPSLPRGLELRARRLDLGLSLRTVSRALGLSAQDYGVLEWQNLLIPSSWLPILAALGFFRLPEPPPESPTPLDRLPTGDWLWRERQRGGRSIEVCASYLKVRPSELGLVERHRWPLLPEWLPLLSKLGLEAPSDSTPSSAESSGATTTMPEPPSEFGKQPGNKPVLVPDSASGVRGSSSTPLTTSGAGMVERAPTQEVEPPSTEPASHSSEAPSGPREVLLAPVPEVLLAPAPDAASAEDTSAHPRQSAPQTASRSGSEHDTGLPILPASPSESTQSSSPRVPFSGTWLRRNRLKKNLTQAELAKALNLPVWTLGEYERKSKPPKAEWLPTLRELGFPVPATPTAQAKGLSPGWLREERRRLGLGVAKVAKELGLRAISVRNIEKGTAPVSHGWLSTLAALGFSLPSDLSGWRPLIGHDGQLLRGARLAATRRRRQVASIDLCRAVRIDSTTLAAIERCDRPIPAQWLPALRKLGLLPKKYVVSSTPTAPEQAQNQSPDASTVPSAVATTKGALVTPEPPVDQIHLFEMITDYRLRMGRGLGAPPHQIFGWILQDIQQAGLAAPMTFAGLEALLAALKGQLVR